MIIVKIIGGLGNQMFQYAFGYAISQRNNVKLKLDISGFQLYDLRQFDLGTYNINYILASNKEVKKYKYKSENLLYKVIRKIFQKNTLLSKYFIKESGFYFDTDVFNVGESAYFDGYWQSEKYFKEYRDELLNIFSLKNGIHNKSQKYKEEINNTNSISLHIRRGDYISNEHTNNVHGVCTLDYYKHAVLKSKATVKNPYYFIFSDDLEWAKNNFNFIKNKTFIKLEKDVPDAEEMYLMSQCNHNIIANSSFSWWGAWLNNNPNKIVIAPKKWFNDESINTKDLIPDEWIRM